MRGAGERHSEAGFTKPGQAGRNTCPQYAEGPPSCDEASTGQLIEWGSEMRQRKYLIAVTHTKPPQHVTLRTFETLPGRARQNAARLSLRIATRKDVPDELLDRTYANVSEARAAAASGGRCEVRTTQSLTREVRMRGERG